MDQEHYSAFIREEANHEIARLKTLLQDSRITEEERGVTLAMLEFYEDPRTTEGAASPQSSDDLRLPRILKKESEPVQREISASKKARAA